MDDLAHLGAFEERARGVDFIVYAHGDLAIRVPRTARARAKLDRERGVREVVARRFPALVARPEPCELPPPLFAVRWATGTPLGADPPSAAFVDALARFLGALHAMTDVPMQVDPAPHTIVRRLQDSVRLHYLPQLPAAEQARFASAVASVLPAAEVVACPQHGDLSARNLLVAGDGTLASVLDWSDAVISDPAIDFGAIAQWAGMAVVDELLARTGRAHDRALRDRAEIVAVLLDAVDRARLRP